MFREAYDYYTEKKLPAFTSDCPSTLDDVAGACLMPGADDLFSLGKSLGFVNDGVMVMITVPLEAQKASKQPILTVGKLGV